MSAQLLLLPALLSVAEADQGEMELNCDPNDCTAAMVRAYHDALCDAASSYHADLLKKITGLASRHGVRANALTAETMLDWSEANGICMQTDSRIDQVQIDISLAALYRKNYQFLNWVGENMDDPRRKESISLMMEDLEWMKQNIGEHHIYNATDIELVDQGDKYQYEVAGGWKQLSIGLYSDEGRIKALEFLGNQLHYLKYELKKPLSEKDRDDAIKASLLVIDLISKVEATKIQGRLPGSLVGSDNSSEKGEITFETQLIKERPRMTRDIDLSNIKKPKYSLGFEGAQNPTLITFERVFNGVLLAQLHFQLEGCFQHYQHPKRAGVTACHADQIFTSSLEATRDALSHIDVSDGDWRTIAQETQRSSMQDYNRALYQATYSTMSHQQIGMRPPYIFEDKLPRWFDTEAAAGTTGGSCPNLPSGDLRLHPVVWPQVTACHALVSLNVPWPLVNTVNYNSLSGWHVISDLVFTDSGSHKQDILRDDNKLMRVIAALGGDDIY